MNMRQVSLSSGTRRMTCWVEEYGARVGNTLTLKGVDGFWKVLDVGHVSLDKTQLNTKWAVGGL